MNSQSNLANEISNSLRQGIIQRVIKARIKKHPSLIESIKEKLGMHKPVSSSYINPGSGGSHVIK